MTLIELRRVFAEWRLRLQRVQHVLKPPDWTAEDWAQFSKALYLLIKKYGTTWTSEPISYWDLRWDLKEGGELICQVEENATSGERTLVVAQSGGFANQVEHYTWFFAELNDEGHFVGDPYWVDGNWKEALAMILLPHRMAAGFYLSDSKAPMGGMLLENGAEKS